MKSTRGHVHVIVILQVFLHFGTGRDLIWDLFLFYVGIIFSVLATKML